jgi:hypothetical protein
MKKIGSKKEIFQLREYLLQHPNSDDAIDGIVTILRMSKTEASSAYSVMSKVAKASSPEEFELFVVNNEIPTVKLTHKEMEMLKGGIGPKLIAFLLGLRDRMFGRGEDFGGGHG